MDQNIGSEAPVDPAAVAFEALRREVALLNAALAGLAAERASAPDYSETLGEIAQGVRVAVGRIGKLATSPALAATPAEIAQQITAAGDEARRQDRATLHQAQDMFQRAASELRGWVDTARVASMQNWRLLQIALAGVVGGAVLGASVPAIVAQAAPEQWAWPERRAARVLHRDMWSAGERLLAVADPQRWQEMQNARRIVEQNRDVLARCVTAAQKRSSWMAAWADAHLWRSWRLRVGYVAQSDAPLFGTVAENIAFFDPEMSIERVMESARAALIHDDIMALPMRYRTLLADMGSNFSGGQCQRLMLARALFRNPAVLVIDEGTSNLDRHLA